MKFSTLVTTLVVASQIKGSPVPAVKWVTEYAYTTVTVGYDQYTAHLASVSNRGTSSAPSATALAANAPTEESLPTEPSPSNDKPPAESSATEVASTQTIAPSVYSSEPLLTPTTTSSESATTSSQASGSVFSGEGTYYDPEMGACGKVNSASDMIVAISHELYDEKTPNGNPNKNTLCGKKIRAFYEGKSVEVAVVDRCVGCARDDLDLSPSAFEKIANKDLGRIKLTWEWAE